MNVNKMIDLVGVIEKTNFKNEYSFDKNHNLILRNCCIDFIDNTFKKFVILPFNYISRSDAIMFCNSVKMYERTNWRMPTRDELKMFLHSLAYNDNLIEAIRHFSYLPWTSSIRLNKNNDYICESVIWIDENDNIKIDYRDFSFDEDTVCSLIMVCEE